MASIFSAKNETILALGNANIDLSLFKFELGKQDVRKEYEGLGGALSVHRRASAENGQQHRTARRLGALFEDIIPNIDVLAGVYGQRASEIAVVHDRGSDSKAQTNPIGSNHNANFRFGPFASHAGIDGTSIYAAASSGDKVIALHLLACMLAKMFTSAEATAIWSQLVAGRMEELKATAVNSQISGVAAKMAAIMGEDIKRNDLAAWDASARAWLEVANTVKLKEETQVRLVHPNLPNIRATNKTYNDMIEIWKLAMITLQNAIQGVPQEISNSAVLLAIRAWHIYPDILVFCPITHIPLHDNLVPSSGTISLGLERSRKDDDGDINWSVSLSHLRYYGEPVAIERSLSVDTDRITLQDLQYIALGCVFSSWINTSPIDVIDASECLVTLGDCLDLPGQKGISHQTELGWLAPLIVAARGVLLSHNNERANALYFVEFGRRRGRRLLDDSFQNITPMFGLLNPYQLFRVSHDFEKVDQEIEQQIAIYRELALDCGFGNDECVVVSLPKVVSRVTQLEEDIILDGHWEIASAIPFQQPTKKHLEDGTMRVVERHRRWVHLNRTYDPALQYLVECDDNDSCLESLYPWDEYDEDLEEVMGMKPTACTCLRQFGRCPIGCRCGAQPGKKCLRKRGVCAANCSCQSQGRKCTSLCDCLEGFAGIQESISCLNIRECRMEYDAPNEDCFWLSLRATLGIDHATSLSDHQFKWQDPPAAFFATYQSREPLHEFRDFLSPLFGCPEQPVGEITEDALHAYEDKLLDYLTNSKAEEVEFRAVHSYGRAALYLTDRSHINMPLVTFSRLNDMLRSGKISPALLRSHLTHVGRHGVKDFTGSLEGIVHTGRTFFRSLDAIAAITELYQDWPDATIKISITKSPLGAAHWAQNLTGEPFDLSERLTGPENHLTKVAVSKMQRANKFACIVMLESGGIDLHLDQLHSVMGVATGNSIYAAEYLLQDPSVEDLSGKSSYSGIRRIIGSLGEPGIVCLVPPPSTKRIHFDSTQYRLVRHDSFDGILDDRFDQCSLHLTLTDWKVKLAVAQGSIDADVLIREALVKVFDGSQWIADLDILKGLEEATTMRLFPCSCSDPGPSALGAQLVKVLGSRLKSIERWDELIMCQDNLLPEEIGAVRASGNWYARLAAVVLASSIGCPLTILPCGKMCLRCSQRMSSWRPVTPKTGRAPLNLLIM